jgi:rubrerythrin
MSPASYAQFVAQTRWRGERLDDSNFQPHGFLIIAADDVGMKRLTSYLLAAAVALIAFTGSASAAVSGQTIKNLNSAFQGESNAANRYAAFAKKADAEGYAQVAKLFRAASAAEAIHRNTHQETIMKLGGKVDTFQLESVTVGTTEENLRAAIKGETYERDTMYPEFLATAKSDDSQPAIRTIQFAHTAEKEHAKLFQEALDSLGNNAPTDYYVCQVCGMTVTQLPPVKCVSCRNSRDEYKKIG